MKKRKQKIFPKVLLFSLCSKIFTFFFSMSKSPKIATKIFKNRQKIASRQTKILSPTGSLNRQLGDKSPFLVTLIKRVLAGLQHQYRQPRAPVQPMTADLRWRVVQHWLGGGLAGSQGRLALLTIWRTVWHMLIEFHALLRFSEVRSLTSHDISFHQGSSGCYMKILVRRSKTDQRGEGQEVFVHERPKWVLSCPVLTRRYLGRLGYGVSGLKGNMQPRVQGASGRWHPQADRSCVRPWRHCKRERSTLGSTLVVAREPHRLWPTEHHQRPSCNMGSGLLHILCICTSRCPSRIECSFRGYFIRRAYKVYHVVYGDEKGGEIYKGKEKSFGFPSFDFEFWKTASSSSRSPCSSHPSSSSSLSCPGPGSLLSGASSLPASSSAYWASGGESEPSSPLFLPGAGVLLGATGGGGAFGGRGGTARGRGGTARGRGGDHAAGGDAHAADGVAHTAGRDDDSASSGSWSGMSGHMTSAINNYIVMVEEGLEDSEDVLQRTQILVRSTGWPSCGFRDASAFVWGVLLDEAASDRHLISTVQD